MNKMIHRKASEVVISVNPLLEKKTIYNGLNTKRNKRRHLYRIFAAKAQFSKKWKRKISE